MSSAIVAKGSQLYSLNNYVFNILKNSNLWIDFSDSSTYTTTGTGNLSLATVTDKSNDARTITVNGTCPFDEGTNSMFNLTGTSNFLSATIGGANTSTNTETVFMVVSQANNTANTPAFFGTNTTGARILRCGSNFGYGRLGSGGIYQLINLPGAQVFVATVQNNAGNAKAYYNGILQGTGTVTYTANATPTRIGQSTPSNILIGNIFEMIFFNDALSDDIRQLIEYYLADKWKIRSTISSPTSITGCTLWLDGNDASTITYSSGTSISQWNDKSGNNYHATQATTARQPTYDSTTKGVNFVQASVQFMVSTAPYTGSANNECVYIVFKNNGASNANLIGTTDTARGRQVRIQTNRISIFNGSTGSITGVYTGINTTSLYVVEFVNVTGRCLVNVNESVTGNSGKIGFASGTWTQVIGGATTSGAVSYDGQIYEIVVFNRTLTGSERNSMLNYLFNKWNINAGPTLFNNTQFASVPPYLRLPLPIDISGCSLWLDAADSTTITLSGSNVTQWLDKSGNGRNGTVTGTVGYTTGAINGNNALSFTGVSNTYIRGSVSITGTRITSFAVATLNSASTQFARVISLGIPTAPDYNNVAYLAPILRSGTDAAMYSFRNNATTNALPITYDVPFLACSVYDGATGTFYVNGTGSNSVTSTGTFAITTYQIGNSLTEETASNYYGYIGEIIIFDRPLSKADQQLIEGYLSQKWRLKTYLPSTHIFKTELSLIPKFDPRKYGCQIWLDASDSSTLTLSGSNVTQWRDKSGFGRHASGYNNTATYNANGLNTNYPGIEFNSSKSMSSTVSSVSNGTPSTTTFPSALVGFVVYKFVGSVDLAAQYNLLGRTVSSSSTIPTPFDFYSNNGNTSRRIGNGTTFTIFTGGINFVTDTSPTFYSFSIRSSTTTTWNESINGTTYTYTTSGGTGASYNDTGTSLVIGGRLDTAVYYSGVISEVILFSQFLSTLERQQVEGYLAWKWGLQSNLPTTHPYRKYPPY